MPRRPEAPDSISAMGPPPRRGLGIVQGSLSKPTRFHVLSVAALLATGSVAFLPIRFPSVVNTYGTIASVHEWVLVRGPNGQLVASTFNHATGLSEGYRVSNFVTGSSVQFTLDPSLMPGGLIAAGDTIGTISSSETQERLIALNGQLAAARGQLAVTASGEKAAIIREAEERLNYARRRNAEYQTVLLRTKTLFETGLIPLGQYEKAENEANALNDAIDIAHANLEAARSGAKPEELNLVHANIAALENEIAAIQKRAATYTLTAPLSGRIARPFSTDTLLMIADTTGYVAQMPVRWGDYSRVATTRDPQVTVRGLRRAVHGRVIALGREMRPLNGETVVIATALLEGSPADLMPGMLTKCDIVCRPLRAAEYVKQLFLSLNL